MKNTLFALFALVLFIAGCSPVNGSMPVTVDPFVAVDRAQRTAEAAKADADMYSRQLTATAEAPIISITATAAAWDMQQKYALATQQAQLSTETARMTATALSYSPTPNATATLIAVNSMATQQFTANDIRRDDLSVQRTKVMNTVYAFMPMLLAFLSIIAALMFAITWARRFSVIPVPVDPRGNPQPMFDIVEGIAFDPDRMTNGAMATKRKDVIRLLPQITAERQDAVTARDQMVDLHTRGGAGKQVIADSKDHPATPEISTPEPPRIEMQSSFPLPSWDLMRKWDGTGGIPVGVSTRGMEYTNLGAHPHIAVIGKTGSGKSRRFLRPFIAGALKAGHKVAIIGKTVDFLPFRDHAVMYPIRELTIEEEANRYALILRGMVEEMNKRDAILSTLGVSTWEKAGRESTIVILDELGNALDLMPREQSIASYRYINGLVKEGRKVGFNIVFASQRAKGFRDIMTQVGRAVFFVEDEMESRNALGMTGAETLIEGYFIGKFGRRDVMGSFSPSDEEITDFLADVPRLNGGNEQKPVIDPHEMDIVTRVIGQGGKMTISVLRGLGLTDSQARDMCERYEQKGWVEVDKRQGNARIVTQTLRDLASKATNPQSPRSLTNHPKASQSAPQGSQSPSQGQQSVIFSSI